MWASASVRALKDSLKRERLSSRDRERAQRAVLDYDPIALGLGEVEAIGGHSRKERDPYA